MFWYTLRIVLDSSTIIIVGLSIRGQYSDINLLFKHTTESLDVPFVMNLIVYNKSYRGFSLPLCYLQRERAIQNLTRT